MGKKGCNDYRWLELEQFDVKTTFLHCELEKQIYMKQPDGLEVEGKEDWLIEEEIFVWIKAVSETMVRKH